MLYSVDDIKSCANVDKVLLGGKVVAATSCDDEEGWVEVYAKDPLGQYIVDDGLLATRIYHGRVEVILK